MRSRKIRENFSQDERPIDVNPRPLECETNVLQTEVTAPREKYGVYPGYEHRTSLAQSENDICRQIRFKNEQYIKRDEFKPAIL